MTTGLETKLRPRALKPMWETMEAYAYLAPATIILLVFHFLPAFYGAYISLFNTNLIGRWRYVGLGNYIALVEDPDFRKAVWNTVLYVLGTVPTGMGIGLFIAWLLNQRVRGLAWLRTAYFVPYVTPIVAISIVWAWIFKEDGAGLLNASLALIGLRPERWLLDPRWAMFSLCLMSVWRHLGYNIVIFLAGIQNIPHEYYEAASIDGARGWSMFRHITWPLLSPTTYFLAIVSIIGSFQVFTQVYVLWPSAGGGPLKSTLVVVKYLYDMGWGIYRFGYAAAIGYILFVIIFTLTILQRTVLGSRVHYQ